MFEEIAVGLCRPGLGGFEHLPQPIDLLLVRGIRFAALLVTPVRRDAKLGVLVHFVGANLDFNRLLAGADDRGMQRAIKIILRCGDVIIELARNVRPQAVDQTERGITVGNRSDDYPDGSDVVQLVER